MTLKNTETNAIISVCTTQQADDGDNEMKFVTEGKYYMDKGKFYIFYEETEDMGMPECSVMVKADKEAVTVRRNGSFRMVMEFKEGNSENIVYHMPYGDMVIAHTTHSVDVNMSEAGGSISMAYTLAVGGEVMENVIEIKVEAYERT